MYYVSMRVIKGRYILGNGGNVKNTVFSLSKVELETHPDSRETHDHGSPAVAVVDREL